MSGLHLQTITHAFGDHQVLKGVSVHVAPGELVCLLGPSGCGKTTLLRIAAGLEPLQQGRVEIDGKAVAVGGESGHLPPEKRGVGLMFQDFALFPHLTVAANIAFGLSARKADRSPAWVRDALSRMGLSEYADVYPHTLSGGQQQRVALLRALAPDPGVLLLDEPFSGLDVTMRAHIRADTLRVVKDAGVATLMVTHDPEEAMFMADRILVMDRGNVVQDGSPVDLYFNPVNAFVAELFGPVNKFEAIVTGGKAETPLGTVTTDLADGTAADVLIRPEGVTVSETSANDGVSAEVVTARLLGRSSFVEIALPCGTRIESRVHGVFLPKPGAAVSLGVRETEAFVFTR